MRKYLGISAEGFSDLLAQVEPIPWYAWISICVFILNFDKLFRKTKVSYRSQKALNLIERGRKNGLISAQEARQRFRLLVQEELDKYRDIGDNV